MGVLGGQNRYLPPGNWVKELKTVQPEVVFRSRAPWNRPNWSFIGSYDFETVERNYKATTQ